MTQRGRSDNGTAGCHIIVLKPLPGERRKTNLPMLCFRNYRSKWWHVECVGDAKACKVSECRHVTYVCEHCAIEAPNGAIQRMRPRRKAA